MISDAPSMSLDLAGLSSYLSEWLAEPSAGMFELIGGPGAILQLSQHPVSGLVRLYVHSRNGRQPAEEAEAVFQTARGFAKNHWADRLDYVDRDGHGTTWIFFYADARRKQC
jgi:hypothetical protein